MKLRSKQLGDASKAEASRANTRHNGREMESSPPIAREKGNVMTKISKVRSVEIVGCDAGWRNYHFVKIVTEDGIVGWSEFDEGFGSPGVGAVIQRLSARVVGQNAFQHER